jgi:UDP-3-O-[3-hydroxymyristoyl] glucosamine N-acyltransferase
MASGMRATVGQLAAAIGGRVVPAQGIDEAAAAARILTGVAGLGDAGTEDLSFLANPKYQGHLATTRAGCVLIGEARPPLPHAVQVVVANPDFALAQLVSAFGPQPVPPAAGIHPTAVIGERVRIGARPRIGPYAVIGDDCVLGDDCVIHAHVVVAAQVAIGSGSVLYPMSSVRERCVLGQRVILHNGVVVGSDGFGYATVDGVHRKIPQVGGVVIEDDVEIGANTAIDRARFGRTRIGAGTKIDNLVQVAHNVDVGAHSLLVAQCGIAGSTRLGHHATIAGQVGIAGHLVLGDRVTVTAQSGVGKNLPDGIVARGSPAQEYKTQVAQEIAVRKLTDTVARVRQLEARLAELEASLAAKGKA